MFIPGCGCCGCKPCPYCSPDCLTATFSGFAHGTGNCGECDFLDDTTFVLERPSPNGRNHFLTVSRSDVGGPGSGASFGTIGITANGTITNVARREDGSFYVTAVTINNGGSGYETPTFTFTPTNFIECRKAAVSVTVTNGAITAVTVDDGGEYYLDTPCEYVGQVCAVCPETAGATLTAKLTIGQDSHTFTVSRGGTLILSATRPALDEDDERIPCDELTFDPEHFSEQYSCVTNGTVTIGSGECGDSSYGGCDLPDQITLSASGIPLIFAHLSSNGFPTSAVFAGELADYCGVGAHCLVSESAGGGSGQSWSAQLRSRNESGIVLDRDEEPAAKCLISYSGVMPTLPGTSGPINGFVFSKEMCGGQLDSRAVSVSIGAVPAETSVSLSGPSWGSYGAEAEATVAGGAVTAITVTNPGEGYAREIFERVEPDMDVTLSGGSGSGAVLSATLTQSGTGENAYWYVDAVNVTDGGTGYAGTEAVVFEPEEGATTDYPAYAEIVTGRIEPTISATAPGGTGADLSVTLSQSMDWNGLDVWTVDAVTVDDGGTGYEDGAAVTFTVDDGTEVYEASATIATGREEPTVTGTVYGTGSGASITTTLTQSGNTWGITGTTIANGGSGYTQGDYIEYTTADTAEGTGYGFVTSVDGGGAITGVSVEYGGAYYRSNGIIESVSLSWGGEYYKSTGEIESVILWEGGAYYKSVSTNTSEVDTPTVTIGSNVGEGATATATVDGTVGSETFGQITGITVTSGGEGYGDSGARWRVSISYDGLGHDSISDRIASGCPSSLLSKSYSMSLSALSNPNALDTSCGEPDESIDQGNGIVLYRWEGVSITLA